MLNTVHSVISVSCLFLLLCIAPCQMFAAEKTCLTSECHTEFQQNEVPTHPEESNCTDCHQGDLEKHGEGPDGNKLDLVKKMCGNCHDELMDHPYLHSPVASGNCSQCHYPHGNIEEVLLREKNSRAFYVHYSDDKYATCFSCHNRDLLMYPETSYATDFRDGIRNLHYLHVTKGRRGKNCIVCHDVHGSDRPKLVAGSIYYGNWKMAIGFVKTATGGGCAPGCHRVKEYDRKIK